MSIQVAEKVPFFIPVESDEKPYLPLLKTFDYYLYLGNEVAVQVEGPIDGVRYCNKDRQESSCAVTILKIASYVLSLGVFPLIALMVKFIGRCVYEFHYKDAISELEATARRVALTALSQEEPSPSNVPNTVLAFMQERSPLPQPPATPAKPVVQQAATTQYEQMSIDEIENLFTTKKLPFELEDILRTVLQTKQRALQIEQPIPAAIPSNSEPLSELQVVPEPIRSILSPMPILDLNEPLSPSEFRGRAQRLIAKILLPEPPTPQTTPTRVANDGMSGENPPLEEPPPFSVLPPSPTILQTIRGAREKPVEPTAKNDIIIPENLEDSVEFRVFMEDSSDDEVEEEEASKVQEKQFAFYMQKHLGKTLKQLKEEEDHLFSDSPSLNDATIIGEIILAMETMKCFQEDSIPTEVQKEEIFNRVLDDSSDDDVSDTVEGERCSPFDLASPKTPPVGESSS